MLVRFILDTGELREAEIESVSQLPIEKVVQVSVVREGFPPVTVVVDTVSGERIHFFTRNSMSVGGDASSLLTVPVYEIQKNGEALLRLYFHPESGPILTTRDLYF